MLENSFLTFDQLAERFPEIAQLGWTQHTLESFHRARLILAIPPKSGTCKRYQIGDVRLLVRQALHNHKLVWQ